MINQNCWVQVFCWLFIGLMVGKTLFYLVESNINELHWMEQHHLLTINSVALIFGLYGFVIWQMDKKKSY
ncbi:hypothetical protein KJK41_04895 [Bacillus haikouensis]|nr:hypothetical protein KJK41_04895 [Bacillus haikouensis]